MRRAATASACLLGAINPHSTAVLLCTLCCACAQPQSAATCATTSVKAQPVAERSPTPALPPRLAYVVFKVTDLVRSLAFYEQALGMQEIFRYDLGGGVTEVGVSFSSAAGSATGQGLALVYETQRTQPLDHGDAFSRFALGVPDIAVRFKHLEELGVPIARAPVAYERFGAIVGFVKDPDGYLIEILQALPAAP